MVDFPASHDIQRLGVQLIADGFLIRACGRDQKVQRLLPGITGALGENIVQFPVGLGMDLVQHEAGNVQAVLGPDLCGKDLIETGIGVVHDPLGGRSNLGSLIERRCLFHHAPRHIENNRCLLPVCCCAIHFCRRLPIGIEKVKRHRCGQLRFSILLADLDVGRPELPVTVLIDDSKNVPDDLLLPRQEPERFPVPLALGVFQVLDKGNGPVSLGLIIMRGRKHKPGRLIVFQFRIIGRSYSCHHASPPSSASSSSSLPLLVVSATIRERDAGVRPNCSAKRFMTFR